MFLLDFIDIYYYNTFLGETMSITLKNLESAHA